MTATHLLVAYRPDYRVIEEFTSYEAALAAYRAVAAPDDAPRAERLADPYAVRSADDPHWARAPRAPFTDPVARAARLAASEWRRKEIGQTARALLVSHADDSFGLHGLLRLPALEPEPARGEGGGDGLHDRAGRLADKECPNCHRRLDQTTLAYRDIFRSLAAETARLTP